MHYLAYMNHMLKNSMLKQANKLMDDMFISNEAKGEQTSSYR